MPHIVRNFPLHWELKSPRILELVLNLTHLVEEFAFWVCPSLITCCNKVLSRDFSLVETACDTLSIIVVDEAL